MRSKANEILKSIPVALILTDSQLKITGCSREAERLFREGEEELRGRSLPSLIAFDAEATSQQIFVAEGIRKDGQRIILECRCSPLKNGFIFACRDITEEVIRRSESEEYRHFFVRSRDVLFRLGKIEINPAFCSVLGYDLSDLVNATFQRLVHPDDVKKVVEEISKVFRGEPARFEFRMLARDGRTMWFEVVAWPWIENSALVGVEGILRDITDRKEREEELKRRVRRLEVLNRVLRHEFCNYLTTLKNFVEIAREDPKSEYFDRIDNVIAQALELIDEVRSAEEVERSEELKPVNLTEVLLREIENVKEPGVIVTTSVPEDLIVMANEMLHVVFDNILRNAVVHNDKDEKRIWASANRVDGWIEVRIADNGPGIPDEVKEEVFKEGFKGESSGRTGLGLYLVKTLIERYGGSIHVEDNEPEGSVFVLRLREV
ncbi:PAS/PAC sensor signal transduction histidine kinase [Archaeoglobus veneficus SNP6]|uniref:histidine kinase n=2 Tax=Archaeoglobus veneficus TaxID=58290 RepID=F2KNK0_ARCVS|nr:PAS/PAC sensor signal transduction histidine kinase [Archaeoglobus veneficus SNP6]